MIWNHDKSVLSFQGSRLFRKGEALPDEVLTSMGKKRLDSWLKDGTIIDGKAQAEKEAKEKLETLRKKAESLGLKPHTRAGSDKIMGMIRDYYDLQALKKEALALGIDPKDNVTFEILKPIVDKAKNESDS